jgi:putative spermidine/putrescine transport system permease protein/mannopine transport system permease protein
MAAELKPTSGARTAAAWDASRGYAWLIAPPALFLALFFVWPVLRVVMRSFIDPVPGLQNYGRIFSSSLYVHVFLNTAETAAIVTMVCLLAGYPVAYALSQARGGPLKLMAALVVIPLWTSVVIRSYAWMIIFQRHGILNDALVASGWAAQPVQFIPGSFAVNVGMVHIMLPFMILPLAAGMRSIDASLMRAAGVLGASTFAAFRKIFFPLSLPSVYAGAALVFMMSLGFFITPALLGGPEHLMAAVLIEQQANQLLDWGLASALATLFLFFTALVYFIYIRLSERGAGKRQR